MATSVEIAANVAQFMGASDKAFAIVNGPATGEGSTVTVGSGELPTMAKGLKDFEDKSLRFDIDQTGLGVPARVQARKNLDLAGWLSDLTIINYDVDSVPVNVTLSITGGPFTADDGEGSYAATFADMPAVAISDGKLMFQNPTTLATTRWIASIGEWRLYSDGDVHDGGIWKCAEDVATPDLCSTWLPVGSETGEPSPVLVGTLISHVGQKLRTGDVPPYSWYRAESFSVWIPEILAGNPVSYNPTQAIYQVLKITGTPTNEIISIENL